MEAHVQFIFSVNTVRNALYFNGFFSFKADIIKSTLIMLISYGKGQDKP